MFFLHLAGRIPLCGILIEGDRSHLRGLSLALQQNIPFVVISVSEIGLLRSKNFLIKRMPLMAQR